MRVDQGRITQDAGQPSFGNQDEYEQYMQGVVLVEDVPEYAYPPPEEPTSPPHLDGEPEPPGMD